MAHSLGGAAPMGLIPISDNHRELHWAQLKVYGALLCASQGRSELQLALVYLGVATGKKTVLAKRWGAVDLKAFWHRQAEALMHFGRDGASCP